MTGEAAISSSQIRYGPLTFWVAMLHIFVVEFATWFLIPYSIVLVLPAVLVYMAISAFVAWAWAPGVVSQICRGMFIGSSSGPLSLLTFISVWGIAKAIGPI